MRQRLLMYKSSGWSVPQSCSCCAMICSGLSMEPRLALKQIRLRELSLCRRVRRLLPRSLPRRKSKRSHLRSPQNSLLMHNLRRRRRSLPPHRTNARFLGPCSSTSSVLRRAVLRVWSVLAVGEYGPFLQAVEFCASSLTTYAKRTLPIPGDDGPCAKRSGKSSESRRGEVICAKP